MTQKDKELLLKDLCSRLPYKVKVQFSCIITSPAILEGIDKDIIICDIATCELEDVKPYLRPMSSITEEEIEELKTLCSIYIPTDSPAIGFEDYGVIVFTHHLTNNTYSFKLDISIIDWLNKKMFDYRGLIPMGLAISVTKENNTYK